MDFWLQTPTAYSAAIDGYSERRDSDHRLDLIVARAVSLWSRAEPRRIPSAKAIMTDKAHKPSQSDAVANARAWIAVLKAQKGKRHE